MAERSPQTDLRNGRFNGGLFLADDGAGALLSQEWFGLPALSATVTATEQADTLTAASEVGTGTPVTGEVTATEAADTLTSTATTGTEETVPVPAAQPTASGGVGFRSDRPVPPKHLTAMVFSNDPPEDHESDERDLAAAHTAAEDGVAALPSSAPLSGDAARAIASGMAAEAAAAVLGPMPARVANDDEEAMMIILALAA